MKRPMVKLCGLQSEEDVITASRSNADFAGFVMAESKRRVSPEAAKSWLEAHPLPGKKIAALFVNAPLTDIQTAVDVLSPDIIQCHGTETCQEVEDIKSGTSLKVWKAIPHDEEALNKMKEYAGVVDGFVIDAKVKGAWGGTGQRFDWSHVPQYVSFGSKARLPVLIAGGITPYNVEDLLSYSPWGIDISSGIEKNGKKEESLVMELEKRLSNDADYVSGR
ncbi:phosphoribosylanthranilate isomerase [Salibacterium aidingense]|uniref:phosphoribosylanthranilate isomerase n=1 Tax=Salibacterium aidingense TaxID=384933 RepID=UPI0004187FA1|nr:phosphoribosylanthranilate isomerase [Salibacterium aidingense]